jgi:hypothetical protein
VIEERKINGAENFNNTIALALEKEEGEHFFFGILNGIFFY